MSRSSLIFVVVSIVCLAAAWGMVVFKREPESSRYIKDAINAVKVGDYTQGRLALEKNLDGLDKLGMLVLSELYAQGLGGTVEEQKASIIVHLLECDGSELGHLEFTFALDIRLKEPVRGTRWLVRAGEKGHTRAIELLSSVEKLKNEGFSAEVVTAGGWGNMRPDKSLSEWRKKFYCRK